MSPSKLAVAASGLLGAVLCVSPASTKASANNNAVVPTMAPGVVLLADGTPPPPPNPTASSVLSNSGALA